MGRILFIIVCLLWSVSISLAQVVPGTVNSKTLDGVGNKITSTVVGADLGLDVNCLNCTGGSGGTSSTFGAPFPATGTAIGFSDGTPNMRPGFAVDADTGAGTQYVQGVNLVFRGVGGPVEAGTVANPLNVTGTTTISNAFLLDATFTGRFPVAYIDADTIANQTTTAIHGQNYMYNGATWDRMRGTIAGGLLVDVSDLFLLDATITNRFPAGSTPADNESNAVTISRIGNFNYIFDGAAWDRWTGAVSQSGTWNINTVTTVTTVNTVTSITNPVTINSSTVGSANNDGACLSGAANFTVAASNASRLWIAIWASPANTDDVYIKLGVTATSADGRFAPGQALNITSGRIYTGQIDAFPNSGTQAVCLMELN